MKRSNIKTVVIALAAVVLIFGGLTLMQHGQSEEELLDPGQSTAQNSSLPEGSSTHDTTQPDPNAIPDMDSTQGKYETPYPPLDIPSLSPTTLTPEEITDDVDQLLAGLLQLDEKAVGQVSPRNISGEHNPFRVMLNACLADDALGAAFRNLGQYTTYEVLDASNTSSSPNVYTVTVSVTTPYMASKASEMATSSEIPYVQELTRFKASGAAQRISGMDLSTIPLNTDLVTLTVIVENDVPMLYYPTSLAYGGRIPQYAFLWGAIEFQGTNAGDLLLNNSYGGSVQLTRNKFDSDPQGAELAAYLDTAFSTFQTADMEKIAALTLAGNKLADQWTLKKSYPEYQSLFKQNPGFEKETMDRLHSFEYETKYLLHTDAESGSTLNSLVITYSTVDPITENRVYQTQQYTLLPGSKSISASEAQMFNHLVSQILEDALGGDPLTAESRLFLKKQLERKS